MKSKKYQQDKEMTIQKDVYKIMYISKTIKGNHLLQLI